MRRGGRRGRGTLFTIALAATATLSLAAAPGSPASQPSDRPLPAAIVSRLRCPERVSVIASTATDIWLRIRGPVFGSPPGPGIPTVRAHAVAPLAPRLLYASDGHSVHRSPDGGCTWDEVFRAAETPGPLDSEVVLSNPRPISALAVPAAPDAQRTVFALIAGGGGRLSPYRPAVVVSRDGGDTWADASAGLPSVALNHCDRCAPPTATLHLAPSDPDVAYVVIDADGTVAPRLLYATDDGGRTWQRRDVPSDAAGLPLGAAGDPAAAAVDPRDAATLWLLTDDLLVSGDGGRTWSVAPIGPLTRPAGLDVAANGGGPARVLLFERGDDGDPARVTHVVRSVDGGRTFTRSPAGTEGMSGVLAVRTGGRVDDVVVTGARLDRDGDVGRAFRWEPATSSFAPVLGPTRSLVDGQADRTDAPWRWYRSGGDLLTTGPVPASVDAPPGSSLLAPLRLNAATVPPGAPATFTPARVALTLAREQERAVTHVLDLPPRPTPVDVWFLVDTSSSQSEAIDGLRTGMQQIVNELAGSGMDAWFGVAEYKNPARAYARLADLAPPGPELAQALADLRASDGGEETQYVALQQTATGRGDARFGVAPGTGASFRTEAVKVIVHATDEAFGEHDDGPTAVDVVKALQAKAIRHVGLAVGVDGTPTPAQSDLVGQLDHLAMQTGTVAPDDGVDCDGDGSADVLPGRPITCAVSAHGSDRLNLVPSIVSAVRAVRRDVDFAVRITPPARVSATVAEALPAVLDIAVGHRLPVTVTYRCEGSTTGTQAPVAIDAVLGGAVVAHAEAAVTCSAPATRPLLAPQPPAVPVLPAPAHPAPQVDAAPAGASAPAAAAQPAPSGALATQPVEAQVASARTDHDTTRDAPPSPALPVAAGGGLAVATAWWMRRRPEPQTAHQRGRPRP